MSPRRATDEKLARIPGWLAVRDAELLRWVLADQTAQGLRGDLAELGVYLGKSACLIGDHVQEGEVFTVIDLFGAPADGAGNVGENADAYPDLTQAAFEAHYRSVHPGLPVVVRGPSSDIVRHARAGAHRFVHVDASHLYEHVRGDVAAARELLGADGVVVFDDFRNAHTPGVAAAVWQEVTLGELHVLALTENKLYAAWDDPGPRADRLARWLDEQGWPWERQEISGRPVVRVGPQPGASGELGWRTRLKQVLPLPMIKAVQRFRRRSE